MSDQARKEKHHTLFLFSFFFFLSFIGEVMDITKIARSEPTVTRPDRPPCTSTPSPHPPKKKEKKTEKKKETCLCNRKTNTRRRVSIIKTSVLCRWISLSIHRKATPERGPPDLLSSCTLPHLHKHQPKIQGKHGRDHRISQWPIYSFRRCFLEQGGSFLCVCTR